MRLLVAMLAVLFLGQATGLAALAEDACVESCPDDDPGGACPPACPTCVCSAHARASVPPSLMGSPFRRPPEATLPFTSGTTAIPSPEPQEILHVPKTGRGS